MKRFIFLSLLMFVWQAMPAQCTAPVVTASGPTTLCPGGSVTLSAPVAVGNTWTQKADFGGVAREGATGFSIGNKGYIGTGGQIIGGSFLKDFWEYDPFTNAWTQKADFGGAARDGATGFSIGSKGYIGTGDIGSGFVKDFWEYDPSTNVWARKADFGGAVKAYATGFSIGNKGYIGTGEDNTHSSLKDFWEYDPSTNAWTRRADFGGAARLDATGFSIGSKGYIGTGEDNTHSSLKDFWEYDPSTNAWTRRADFGGAARYGATGFSIGNKGYIGTGFEGYIGTGFGYYRDFWEYNPSTNVWTQKADLGGAGRFYATGFSIGSKGYISTGIGNSYNSMKDFWEYDLGSTYSWSPGGQTTSSITVSATGNYTVTATNALGCSATSAAATVTVSTPVTPVITASGPTAFCLGGSITLSAPVGNAWTRKADVGGSERFYATGFSIGNKGYIGTGYSNSNYTKDFWEYDPATDAWTQKADVGGVARYRATGFSIGSKGYIGTGGTSNGILGDFWEYDPATNVWAQKANFGGIARKDATGFCIGNKGYIGTGGNGNYSKDFWEYDPATNTWAQKADFGGAARSDATSFSIGNKGYIGTGSANGSSTKDFWEYNPATNAWTQKTDFGGAARAYSTGFSVGGRGYIGTGSGGGAKDFWEYNPSADTWIQRADFGGSGRVYAVGFSIGSKGYIGTGSSTKDFWEYSPALGYSWSPGGQTTSSITVSASGSYTVTATNLFGCSATSAVTTVTVNTPVTPSVSILASSTNICSGTSVTFTATPTNGGTAPAYQWQKNGAAISGATSATYTTATLANNDVISVVMTSNAACATPATVTSNSITIMVIENTGGVVYVDSSRTSSGSGASWANAYKELREALNAARQCSNITSILVAKGTYKPTGNTDRDSAFTILRGGLKIYGGYNASTGIRNITGNLTILSGNINTAAANDNSYHVVVIAGLGNSADSLVLDGITVSGGYANGGATKLYNGETFYQTEGAGICISNSNGSGGKIALRNCSFIADTASANGGAIYNRASSPTITNCGFTSNYAGGGGGGIFNNNYASPAISRCTFNASRAGKGGGIYNYSYSSPVISNTVFTGNTTVGRGGAVYSEDNSSPSFNSDVFNANNAGDGGAVAAYFYAPSTFANCVFVQNSAGSEGGAIAAINNSPTTITNCTFTANNAVYGGAMDNYLSSNATISNSIFWGNTGTYPLFDNSNSIVLISNSIVQGGYTGTGNYNADPLFVNTADPDGADNIFGTADDGLKLQAGSPAVNTGSNAAASGITTDVTGAARIQSGMVDMGAYEGFLCLPSTVVYVDGSRATSGDGSSWANAFTELSSAVAAAGQCSSISTIYVARGRYKPTSTTDRDSAFVISRGGLKIYGGYPSGGGTRNAFANATILSGDIGTASDTTDNSYHILVLAGLSNTADSVVVDGFTLTGGHATGTGSKIYNGIAIDRNHAAAIAAEQNTGSKLAFRNLVFANNASSDGWGAAMVLNTSNAVLDKCVFYGNSTSGTGQGGAILNNSSTTVMTNCLLYNNYGAGLGGAIQLNGTNPLSIINSTFYNNRTAGNGGAIRSGAGSVLNLSNTIFNKNDIGAQNGTYVAPGNDLTLVGTYTITNCLMQNAAANYSGVVNSLFGTNPLFTNETNGAGADNIFGTADDGLHLQMSSMAINRGSNLAIPAGMVTDMAGAIRIQDGIVDMGAYESSAVILPLTLLQFSGSVVNSNDALLSWRTANEVNTSHFELQRSTDGRRFSNIATLQAKGTNTGMADYGYTEKGLQPGTYYYRLYITDKDGKAMYSSVVALTVIKEGAITLYPVPAKTNIWMGGNATNPIGKEAILLDVQGRVFQNIRITQWPQRIDISALVPGTYIVKLPEEKGITFIKQ